MEPEVQPGQVGRHSAAAGDAADVVEGQLFPAVVLEKSPETAAEVLEGRNESMAGVLPRRNQRHCRDRIGDWAVADGCLADLDGQKCFWFSRRP